jgi:hypothetical protein
MRTEEAAVPVENLGADLEGFQPSEADKLIESVCGNHPHRNDGCCLLDGVVLDDLLWKNLWKRIVQLLTTHCAVPKGRTGRRFFARHTREFQGVMNRTWNSERPLAFAACILQTARGVCRATDVQARLEHRLDLFDLDQHVGEVLSRGGGGARSADDKTIARVFNAEILSDRLQQAAQALTRREEGGVSQPDDACAKTGRPALEVLRDKHPQMRVPDLEAAD